MRKGLFQNDLLIQGTLTGNENPWKNMDFEYVDGIGKGTYNTEDVNFKGCVKNTEFEKEVWHGKCKFSYKDGRLEEEEYDEGYEC